MLPRHLALCLLVLLLAACAHPNMTLHQAARPSVPVGAVRIITDDAAAKEYAVMGQAFAWSNVPVSRHVGYERAVQLLRQRAAGVGASAIWVPPADRIWMPDVQARWMDRVEGWYHESRGGSDYVEPQELRAVLLVRD